MVMETNKQSHSNFLQNAKKYFLEFCNRTGMHGFNFLAEPKRTIVEKIWWSTIIFAAIYLSIVMVYQSFHKWKTSPILVSFGTEPTPIWKIPFPAVTICPEVKADKRIYNYTHYYLKKEASEYLTFDETAQFEYMALLCDPDDDLLVDNFTTVDVAAMDFLYEIKPSFSESIISATWRGKDNYEETVTEMFSPIITSEGFCYTFNIMDHSELFRDSVVRFKDTFSSHKTTWSVENGYTEGTDFNNAYPRRTTVTGTKGGLNILLRVSREDNDHLCTDSFTGFRIVLHPPDEIPRVKQKYFRLPLDHAVVVGIKPSMLTTSLDLKDYHPSARRCYFNEEKQLQFFKVYNQENCMLECLANFTLEYCGCTSMHSPRINGMPICGASIKWCLNKAKSTFTQNQDNPKTKCDCPPSCNTLNYNAEISQSRWNWRPVFEVKRHTKDWNREFDDQLPNVHLSQLTVYYKDMQFIKSERNELYSIADFLSNCGGLFGLFTGFTFISAFEVIYYLTLRVLFNMYMFGYRNWHGEEKCLTNKDRTD